MLLRCYRFAGRSWQHFGPSWSYHRASSKSQSQLKLCPPRCYDPHNGGNFLQRRMLQSETQPSRPLEIGHDDAPPIHDPLRPSIAIDSRRLMEGSDADAEGTRNTSQDYDEPLVHNLTPSPSPLISEQSQNAGKDDFRQNDGQDFASSQTPAPPLRSSYPSPGKFARLREQREKRKLHNRRLKDKGDLSRDWKQPLELLKQSTPVSGGGSPVTQHIHRTSLYRPTKLLSKQADFPHRIKEPAQWSQTTLTQYVRDLTSYRPPRILLWRLSNIKPGAERPHTNREIGETLDALFHETSMRKHLTGEACHLAMVFFAQKAMIARARKLFVWAEHLSLGVGTPAMNAMMRRAAHEKDLFIFTWLLQAMIRQGLSPDVVTWYHFIRCLDEPSVRRIILTDLQRIFSPISPTLRLRFLRITVGDEAERCWDNNSNLEILFKDLQDRYGPKWLPDTTGTLTGNEIINAMVTRISGNTMLQMVEELTKYGFVPNEITLLMLVNQCLRLGHMEDALKVTQYFHTQYNVEPGRSVHDVLAKYAWRHQLLNVSKLIWTSACFKAFVTWKMQSRVAWSLRFSATEASPAADPTSSSTYRPVKQPRKRRKLFTSLAGKFLLTLAPLEPHSHETVRDAMNTNLACAGKLQLETPLASSLLGAYAVDRQWMIWRGEDVAAKLADPWPIMVVPVDEWEKNKAVKTRQKRSDGEEEI